MGQRGQNLGRQGGLKFVGERKMKAACYNRYGPAHEVLEIRELPIPQPAAGEIRVRIHTSGISPSDIYSRSGRRKRPWTFEYIVPHQDGAGVIDAVGEGVASRLIGERVWLYKAQWQRQHGTAAEYITLPLDLAVVMPASLGFAEGASLGIPAITAHRAVTLGGSIAGQTVLVAGGAGAVGYYATQLAKAKGARVIATAGNPKTIELARGAGADHVIDYRTEPVAERVAALTSGRGVDRVLEVDLAANASLLPGVLCKGGSIVVYGSGQGEATFPATAGIQNSWSMHFVYLYDMSTDAIRAALAELTAMLHSNALKHLPVRCFPLAAIADAHAAVEAGNHGTRMIVEPLAST